MKKVLSLVCLLVSFSICGAAGAPENAETKPALQLIKSKKSVFIGQAALCYVYGSYGKENYEIEQSDEKGSVKVKRGVSLNIPGRGAPWRSCTTWNNEYTIKTQCESVRMSCHPSYPLLFICTKDNEISVWDLKKESLIHTIVYDSDVQAMRMKGNGELILRCKDDEFYNFYYVGEYIPPEYGCDTAAAYYSSDRCSDDIHEPCSDHELESPPEMDHSWEPPRSRHWYDRILNRLRR